MIAGLTIEYAVGNSSDELALQRMRVAFERLDANFDSFGKFVFPKLTQVFEEATRRQFDNEGGGPNRGSWEALSPGYAAWKEGVAPGKPILELTGRLRAALTSSSSPFSLRRTDGEEFEFGTEGLEYPSFMQTGTARMPSRPPFDFDSNVERDLERVGAEAMREAIKDSGVSEFAEVRT